MDRFMMLIVLMFSQVYTYLQTPQIVDTKNIGFLYQLCVNKAGGGI